MVALPHEGAWKLHDLATGRTSDKSAIERSYDISPPVDLTAWNPYRAGGFPSAGVQNSGPVARDPLLEVDTLSLVPGQDFGRAAEKGPLRGMDYATLLDFAPAAAAWSTGTGTAAAFAPARFGGRFTEATMPHQYVPRLLGNPSSKEVLDASIRARQQLATTGRAEVTVGGKTFVVDQTPADRAIRDANRQATLSAHTSPDVTPLKEGGVVPDFPTKGANSSCGCRAATQPRLYGRCGAGRQCEALPRRKPSGTVVHPARQGEPRGRGRRAPGHPRRAAWCSTGQPRRGS